MARNRRRSRSSRSESPSFSPNRLQGDDIEAQMSAVGSPITESKEGAASVGSTKSSGHSTPADAPGGTSFDAAPSPGIQVVGGPYSQFRERVAHIVNEGVPLQFTNSANVPLPPSVENLSQHGGHDSKSAGGGIASFVMAEDIEASPGHQKKQDKRDSTQETSDAWKKCVEAVWKYEGSRVEKWKEDVNNLLLFSGLFSTVLTGFIVQYYVQLQMQQPDASAQALVIISSQLVAISGQLSALGNGAVHLNVTQPIIPPAATLPYIPPTSRMTISTCTLWFMALVCSLGAALIGIVVSQWLRHHGDQTASTSQQSVRIWYFRNRGFIDWKVQDIIDTLPLLLQISVALFLVGLVQLLFTMNIIVAGIVTALVAALLAFSMGTAFIPAFVSRCPYKSPQAWWCISILQWLKKHLEPLRIIYRFLCRSFSLVGYLLCHPRQVLRHGGWPSQYSLSSLKNFRRNVRTYSSWLDLEYFLVSSQKEDNEDKLHMMVLADEILMDESSFLNVIIPCLEESNLETALPVFYTIIQRRAQESKPSYVPDWPDLIWYKTDSNGQLITALIDMAQKMFTRVTSHEESWDTEFRRVAEQARILRMLQSLLGTMSDTQSVAILYSHLSLVNVEVLHYDEMIASVLGDLTVDMYVKGTSADEVVLSEAQQLHILKIMNKLLCAMPGTQPGAAAYLRLCALADPARLSDDVRKRLAELIVRYYTYFEHDIKDIRPMLLAISSCQDLDPDKFSVYVARIMYHSAKLPRAEFEGIHDELRGALAAVAEYFGRPDAAALADLLTQGRSLNDFWFVSGACVALAKVDHGLFTPEIVDALGQFSLLCPDGIFLNEGIRGHMKALRELTGLPPHPEVAPAADSQSSSATDS